jgi:hypothetical protein
MHVHVHVHVHVCMQNNTRTRISLHTYEHHSPYQVNNKITHHVRSTHHMATRTKGATAVQPLGHAGARISRLMSHVHDMCMHMCMHMCGLRVPWDTLAFELFQGESARPPSLTIK